MSIKKEVEVKNKFTIKGILESVGNGTMEVVDEKSGETESFNFNDLDVFIGKSINFTVADSVKKDIENNSENDEDEVDTY